MKQKMHLFIFLGTLLLLSACGSSAASYNNQGNKEFEAGEYPAALDNYRTAQQENPDLAEPYYNAGNALHRQGSLEAAAAQTQQSIRTAEDELSQKSHYNLGNTYFRAKDWPAAIEAYKEALRINPDDVEAKYNLELALKKLQEQQQQQQQQQQQGGGGGQPDQEQNEQGGGQGQEQQDQSQNSDQEQPGGGGQPEPDESDQSGGGQQPDQQSGGPRGLTPQEAEQLLDALGQDSQTLQERLQQGFFAPGAPPGKDW
jgi:Ca-activated chloride channel family protein